jgi:hypothetical protein
MQSASGVCFILDAKPETPSISDASVVAQKKPPAVKAYWA